MCPKFRLFSRISYFRRIYTDQSDLSFFRILESDLYRIPIVDRRNKAAFWKRRVFPLFMLEEPFRKKAEGCKKKDKSKG